MDSGAESVAIAHGADKIDEQPVIPSSSLIAKNDGRSVVAVDRDIDTSIVIQISESCPSRRQWHPKSWTALLRYIPATPAPIDSGRYF